MSLRIHLPQIATLCSLPHSQAAPQSRGKLWGGVRIWDEMRVAEGGSMGSKRQRQRKGRETLETERQEGKRQRDAKRQKDVEMEADRSTEMESSSRHCGTEANRHGERQRQMDGDGEAEIKK